MSWQEYVDNQLVGSGNVSKAAICGLDGSIWAITAGFEITAAEAGVLAKSFGSQDNFQKGLVVGAIKYIYLSGDDNIMRAKKQQTGLIICKTTKAVIVAQYTEPIQGPQCATTVEALAEYLRNCGY